MIHIVMVEPEIPANTGNISRTCAVTGAKLHLIKPLGFDISEKAVRRAGLDYWDKLDIEIHESLEEYIKKYGLDNTYMATTKAKNRYSDIKYEIEKIRDKFHQNIITVITQLYDFEEASYRIIEDIAKEIGYNQNISIKRMLWEIL